MNSKKHDGISYGIPEIKAFQQKYDKQKKNTKIN